MTESQQRIMLKNTTMCRSEVRVLTRKRENIETDRTIGENSEK